MTNRLKDFWQPFNGAKTFFWQFGNLLNEPKPFFGCLDKLRSCHLAPDRK
jgi:hypothetical protein